MLGPIMGAASGRHALRREDAKRGSLKAAGSPHAQALWYLSHAMNVLFLSQPFEPKTTDVAFQAEREAAIRAGLTTALVSDALDDGAFDAAVSRLPRQDTPTTSVFRGWMMNDSAYSAFFAALEAAVRADQPSGEYR